MTSQDNQENQYYEQNQMKDEIQNQSQIQKGKRSGYYKNFKDPLQRGNQNSNNLEDKLSNQNINDYNNNFQNYRKHPNKKYPNYQGKNQNEEFDNRQRNNSPQGSKKTKKKKKEIMNEYNYIPSNTMENSNNIKEEFIFDNHQQMFNKQ